LEAERRRGVWKSGGGGGGGADLKIEMGLESLFCSVGADFGVEPAIDVGRGRQERTRDPHRARPADLLGLCCVHCKAPRLAATVGPICSCPFFIY
jgi:hypothetical protein